MRNTVAGLDAAYDAVAAAGGAGRCWAAAVLWDLQSGLALEEVVAEGPVSFPYVPGLLALRELSGLLEALRRLRGKPDVLLCDGHGIAHPVRDGLACHLGRASGLPTIGCAKRRLVGEYQQPAAARGSRTALLDHGDRIGTVLRTKAAVRPIFVSVGYLASLPEAERLVMDCVRRSRIPEPLRLAHILATRAAQEPARGR